MMRTHTITVGFALGALVLLGAPASAQAPLPGPPSPRAWTANASFGLALTNGNADTSTLNVGYEIFYDPTKVDPLRRNSIRSVGLYFRGESEDVQTSNRLALSARDEYRLRDGMFVYGQGQYLRDPFKEITHLVAPTAGLGYRAVNTPKTTLSFDGGFGAVWEKNTGRDTTSHGALSIGDKLTHKLSGTATFTQGLTALYRTDNFSDALYVFSSVVAASINTRTQLKFEFVDTYKNLTPSPSVQKNDVAFVTALVYKN